MLFDYGKNIWESEKERNLYFKLSEPAAKSVEIPMTNYESQWKQALYYIDPGKTKIEDYERLFELAYKKLTGN